MAFSKFAQPWESGSHQQRQTINHRYTFHVAVCLQARTAILAAFKNQID